MVRLTKDALFWIAILALITVIIGIFAEGLDHQIMGYIYTFIGALVAWTVIPRMFDGRK